MKITPIRILVILAFPLTTLGQSSKEICDQYTYKVIVDGAAQVRLIFDQPDRVKVGLGRLETKLTFNKEIDLDKIAAREVPVHCLEQVTHYQFLSPTLSATTKGMIRATKRGIILTSLDSDLGSLRFSNPNAASIDSLRSWSALFTTGTYFHTPRSLAHLANMADGLFQTSEVPQVEAAIQLYRLVIAAKPAIRDGVRSLLFPPNEGSLSPVDPTSIRKLDPSAPFIIHAVSQLTKIKTQKTFWGEPSVLVPSDRYQGLASACGEPLREGLTTDSLIQRDEMTNLYQRCLERYRQAVLAKDVGMSSQLLIALRDAEHAASLFVPTLKVEDLFATLEQELARLKDIQVESERIRALVAQKQVADEDLEILQKKQKEQVELTRLESERVALSISSAALGINQTESRLSNIAASIQESDELKRKLETASTMPPRTNEVGSILANTAEATAGAAAVSGPAAVVVGAATLIGGIFASEEREKQRQWEIQRLEFEKDVRVKEASYRTNALTRSLSEERIALSQGYIHLTAARIDHAASIARVGLAERDTEALQHRRDSESLEVDPTDLMDELEGLVESRIRRRFSEIVPLLSFYSKKPAPVTITSICQAAFSARSKRSHDRYSECLATVRDHQKALLEEAGRRISVTEKDNLSGAFRAKRALWLQLTSTSNTDLLERLFKDGKVVEFSVGHALDQPFLALDDRSAEVDIISAEVFYTLRDRKACGSSPTDKIRFLLQKSPIEHNWTTGNPAERVIYNLSNDVGVKRPIELLGINAEDMVGSIDTFTDRNPRRVISTMTNPSNFELRFEYQSLASTWTLSVPEHLKAFMQECVSGISVVWLYSTR